MAELDDVIANIRRRIDANDPRFSGIKAQCLLDITGEGGGQWCLSIADGVGQLLDGGTDDPSVTITCEARNFIDLATGKLNGPMAFMTGKLKVKGDMGLALKLQSLFT